jgi:tetraacyldisaccharide 4'-kinase
VLTRGYKSGLKQGKTLVYLNSKVVFGEILPDICPDEALMQSMKLPNTPIIVGSNRASGALAWINFCEQTGRVKPNVWILDDGFQHRKIYRDLDIVLLDSMHPFGKLLPSDHFREPAESLQRAHVALFTRSGDRKPGLGDIGLLSALNPSMRICKSTMEFLTPQCVHKPLDLANDGNLMSAVAGIAKPDDFKKALLQKGCRISSEYWVGDHERFDLAELQKVAASGHPIITTEKDWARCQELFKQLPVNVFVLPMKVVLPSDIDELISSARIKRR